MRPDTSPRMMSDEGLSPEKKAVMLALFEVEKRDPETPGQEIVPYFTYRKHLEQVLRIGNVNHLVERREEDRHEGLSVDGLVAVTPKRRVRGDKARARPKQCIRLTAHGRQEIQDGYTKAERALSGYLDDIDGPPLDRLQSALDQLDAKRRPYPVVALFERAREKGMDLLEFGREVGWTPPVVDLFKPTGEAIKGTRPYGAEDASVFFGRQQDVSKLVSAIVGHKNCFIRLQGPSGCGKTSLLQAGLVPSLPGDWIPLYALSPAWRSVRDQLIEQVEARGDFPDVARELALKSRPKEAVETYRISRATNPNRKLPALVFIFDQFEMIQGKISTDSRVELEEFIFWIIKQFRGYPIQPERYGLVVVVAVELLHANWFEEWFEERANEYLPDWPSSDVDPIWEKLRLDVNHHLIEAALSQINAVDQRLGLSPEAIKTLTRDLFDFANSQVAATASVPYALVYLQLLCQGLSLGHSPPPRGEMERWLERVLYTELETMGGLEGPVREILQRLAIRNYQPTIRELFDSLHGLTPSSQIRSTLESLAKIRWVRPLPENRWQLAHQFLVSSIHGKLNRDEIHAGILKNQLVREAQRWIDNDCQRAFISTRVLLNDLDQLQVYPSDDAEYRFVVASALAHRNLPRILTGHPSFAKALIKDHLLSIAPADERLLAMQWLSESAEKIDLQLVNSELFMELVTSASPDVGRLAVFLWIRLMHMRSIGGPTAEMGQRVLDAFLDPATPQILAEALVFLLGESDEFDFTPVTNILQDSASHHELVIRATEACAALELRDHLPMLVDLVISWVRRGEDALRSLNLKRRRTIAQFPVWSLIKPLVDLMNTPGAIELLRSKVENRKVPGKARAVLASLILEQDGQQADHLETLFQPREWAAVLANCSNPEIFPLLVNLILEGSVTFEMKSETDLFGRVVGRIAAMHSPRASSIFIDFLDRQLQEDKPIPTGMGVALYCVIEGLNESHIKPLQDFLDVAKGPQLAPVLWSLEHLESLPPVFTNSELVDRLCDEWKDPNLFTYLHLIDPSVAQTDLLRRALDEEPGPFFILWNYFVDHLDAIEIASQCGTDLSDRGWFSALTLLLSMGTDDGYGKVESLIAYAASQGRVPPSIFPALYAAMAAFSPEDQGLGPNAHPESYSLQFGPWPVPKGLPIPHIEQGTIEAADGFLAVCEKVFATWLGIGPTDEQWPLWLWELFGCPSHPVRPMAPGLRSWFNIFLSSCPSFSDLVVPITQQFDDLKWPDYGSTTEEVFSLYEASGIFSLLLCNPRYIPPLTEVVGRKLLQLNHRSAGLDRDKRRRSTRLWGGHSYLNSPFMQLSEIDAATLLIDEARHASGILEQTRSTLIEVCSQITIAPLQAQLLLLLSEPGDASLLEVIEQATGAWLSGDWIEEEQEDLKCLLSAYETIGSEPAATSLLRIILNTPHSNDIRKEMIISDLYSTLKKLPLDLKGRTELLQAASRVEDLEIIVEQGELQGLADQLKHTNHRDRERMLENLAGLFHSTDSRTTRWRIAEVLERFWDDEHLDDYILGDEDIEREILKYRQIMPQHLGEIWPL